jgi:hypothetical protein
MSEGLLKFAQENGFAAVCLCALAIAVWRVIVWTGNEVVKPLVQAGAVLLRTAGNVMEEQAGEIGGIRKSIDEEVTPGVHGVRRRLDELFPPAPRDPTTRHAPLKPDLPTSEI